MKKFYANGKLLLTGEYVVLDGALALALPTQYGQGLVVEKRKDKGLKWESYDEHGKAWLQHTFQHFNTTVDNPTVERLRLIFNAIQELNPDFQHNHTILSTHLTFPKDWGLGSSSTLISLLSQWAEVNPFELLEKTFGGSGYDIACALSDQPILYQLEKKEDTIVPTYQAAYFEPSFDEHLYFVYLGNKQDSREGIQRYKSKVKKNSAVIEDITEITKKIYHAKSLLKFEMHLKRHETIISKLIGLPKVQDKHFEYYWGVVKSLGAWGGDFVLVTSHKSYEETKRYFNEKGFEVFLRYEEMVL